MTLTRIETSDGARWQITMTDDDVAQIMLAIVTGMIGNAHSPNMRAMGDEVIENMLHSEEKSWDEFLSKTRGASTPSRFLVDAAILLRQGKGLT